MHMFGAILISILAVTGAILALIFVLVPLLRGIGAAIGGVVRLAAWLVRHLLEYVLGTCGDLVRFLGGLPTFLVLALLTVVNVVIGRWSAAGHFAAAARRECHVASACLYRALVRRPLKLLLLHGLLEGLEQRLPQAVHAAPTSDTPSRHTGQFDGYAIVGSLRAGGSGAKLYVAQPSPQKLAASPHLPQRVVIKSFALNDGSSLPQIVRESRALECAKSMGHVLDHGMSEHRFFYVMPYIPGDHLGVITRQFHGQSDSAGLGSSPLARSMAYMKDLLATLAAYHRGGLWHKDVKPENVIVHDDRAHLVDLGLVTSLHSPMTLTTHGTEYFRDPEMVRLALRGVKVHQVDGAKFDIYGVGAVLYFMLENTFPAHGGLSAFTKRAPEALRWIIRRAMADYQKRYETAQAMLADLEVVSAAADPFVLRPVELPSMRGASNTDVPEPDAPAAQVATAGSPTPPKPAIDVLGLAMGIGNAGPFAQVGRFNLDEEGNPVPPPARPDKRHPKLRVLNWWTGAYTVDDAVAGVASVAPVTGDGGSSAWSPEAQARAAAAGARRAARSAHQAAREQIRSARTRVADIRRRAATSRLAHRSVKERQPSAATIAVSLVTLAVGAVLLMPVLQSRSRAVAARQQALAHVDLAQAMPEFAALAEALRGRQVEAAAAAPDARRVPGARRAARVADTPGTLVVDARDARQYDPDLTRRLHELVAKAVGGTVVSDSGAGAVIAPLKHRLRAGDESAVSELERLLAAKNCSLLVAFIGEDDPAGGVFLTYPPLGHRLPAGALAGRKLVLVNDHPRAAHNAVHLRVEALREAYRRRGCEFVEPEPDTTAELVVLLQRRRMDATGKVADELPRRLGALRLAGLLHVTAPPAAAPSTDEIRSELIEADPAAEPAPAAEPSPSAASSAPVPRP